ncbi:MAG: HEAT repeat domain-containing protein [Chloroflexota bacterium]
MKGYMTVTKAPTYTRRLASLICCATIALLLCVPGCTPDAPEGPHTPPDSEEPSPPPDETDEAELAQLMTVLREDADPDERWWAAAALGELGDTRAVPALTKALRGDKEQKVRTQAACSLGRIGSPRAVDDLLSGLEDEERVRRQAARALGEIGADKAVGPLCEKLLDDSSPYVRQSAAWALGQIGSDAAVDALVQALEKDAASHVRRSVPAALAAIGDEQSVGPLVGALEDRDVRVRWEAAKAVSTMGQAAVELLVSTLGQGSGDARWFAAFALERTGRPKARQEVDLLLEERDIDLKEVSQDYRADWPYEAMVLALTRHGTREMASYYANLDPDDFDHVDHWLIVTYAAGDWLRETD